MAELIISQQSYHSFQANITGLKYQDQISKYYYFTWPALGSNKIITDSIQPGRLYKNLPFGDGKTGNLSVIIYSKATDKILETITSDQAYTLPNPRKIKIVQDLEKTTYNKLVFSFSLTGFQDFQGKYILTYDCDGGPSHSETIDITSDKVTTGAFICEGLKSNTTYIISVTLKVANTQDSAAATSSQLSTKKDPRNLAIKASSKTSFKWIKFYFEISGCLEFQGDNYNIVYEIHQNFNLIERVQSKNFSITEDTYTTYTFISPSKDSDIKYLSSNTTYSISASLYVGNKLITQAEQQIFITTNEGPPQKQIWSNTIVYNKQRYTCKIESESSIPTFKVKGTVRDYMAILINAEEWNGFLMKINDLREYLKQDRYDFNRVKSLSVMQFSSILQAVEILNPLLNDSEKIQITAETQNKNDNHILASYFTCLSDAYNKKIDEIYEQN